MLSKNVAVEKFNHAYRISPDGIITRIKTGEEKTQYENPTTKYMTVRLDIGKKKGQRRTFDVHVLVMLTHVGPRPAGAVINHKDGNKKNNCLDNLEYITSKENHKHAKEHGLLKAPRKRVKYDISKIKTYDIPGYSEYCIDRNRNIYNKETTYLIRPFNSKDDDGNGMGYDRISLKNDNGERKKLYVHDIVALVFIPNPNNYPIVDHINENRQDNRIENLEWVTYSENMRRSAEKKGLSRKVEQYDLKGNLIATFKSVKEAADKTGANNTAIIHVCAGTQNKKTAGGFKWKYAK